MVINQGLDSQLWYNGDGEIMINKKSGLVLSLPYFSEIDFIPINIQDLNPGNPTFQQWTLDNDKYIRYNVQPNFIASTYVDFPNGTKIVVTNQANPPESAKQQWAFVPQK